MFCLSATFPFEQYLLCKCTKSFLSIARCSNWISPNSSRMVSISLFTCGGAKQVYKSLFFVGPVCSTGVQKTGANHFNLSPLLFTPAPCPQTGSNLKALIELVKFPWSQISREVEFPGKSNYQGSQISGKSNFPGSQISREFKFLRKSDFPGSQLSRFEIASLFPIEIASWRCAPLRSPPGGALLSSLPKK